MNDFWTRTDLEPTKRAVAKLASILHYEQHDSTGWWLNTKLDNGAILSVKWPSRIQAEKYGHLDREDFDLAVPA